MQDRPIQTQRILRLCRSHSKAERNHQGLENELIEGASERNARVGRIRRRPRLGGLLNYYYRDAA